MTNIVQELKRRKVFRVAGVYAGVAFILLQLVDIVFPILLLPDWSQTFVVVLLGLGFPVAVSLAWAFDVTPEGIKKTDYTATNRPRPGETSQRLIVVIIALLSFILIILIIDNIWNISTIATAAGSFAIIMSLSIFAVVRNKKITPTSAEHNLENIQPDPGAEKSIAVLAFADLSPNKDQEYFSDGISEELLNLLAKINELKVISRTSSFSYKGKDTTVEQIGEELDVTYILEGSVRKAGDQLRITAQLINVSDGFHLWSETYDRNMEDIFKIQDDIAKIVTQQLKITILGQIPAVKTVETEAYTMYLQANELHLLRDTEKNNQAEALLNKSIAIDPNYAPSWHLLSLVKMVATANYYQYPYQEGLAQAKKAAEKSISLDNNYGMAYAVLSRINNLQWDFAEANNNLNKALALDGGNSNILGQAAYSIMDVGRLEEALDLFQRALHLDPFHYNYFLGQGIIYLWLIRLDKAEELLRKFIKNNAVASISHSILCHVYLLQEKYPEALEEAEREVDDYWKLYSKCGAVYALGKHDEANKLLSKLMDMKETTPSVKAAIFSFRTDVENTFLWLNAAFEQKDPDLVQAFNYPSFRIIHNDPRWKELLIKMNFSGSHWLLPE